MPIVFVFFKWWRMYRKFKQSESWETAELTISNKISCPYGLLDKSIQMNGIPNTTNNLARKLNKQKQFKLAFEQK